eukprot:TRINITY_DN9518_c0_g1_i1.p1 TRINITY_DN9518_c0_g1~~TRINITY_DN9518_c0_g1_i1.p1  ORF type:complete len:365 (+),score=73.63 TRINITY_DN9518_c0_g1_i1:47-1141(+)
MGSCVAKKNPKTGVKPLAPLIDEPGSFKMSPSGTIIKKEDDTYELLLLGTGDSGKSTFSKQMTINFVNERKQFSVKEQEKYAEILKGNVLLNMQMILWEIEEDDQIEQLSKQGQEAFENVINCSFLDIDTATEVEFLWENEDFVRSVAVSHNGLDSQYRYFFDNCSRFSELNFVPSLDDILKARIKTSGINETKFEVDGCKFNLVDVGGQRSERRKWLTRFSSQVTAVLYLVASDEFDRVLEEDHTKNRFDESLMLFSEVTSSQWFNQTPFILFLNKIDMLETKIAKHPDAVYQRFKSDPNMTHSISSDYSETLQYIEGLYRNNYGSNSEIYVYPICAIDSDCTLNVFKATQDVILRLELDMNF